MARKIDREQYKKTAGKREVSISNTEWKKGVAGKAGKAGRLYGPKGQLYSGTVKMQDGSSAVYKDGKRVVKKAAPKTTGGGVTKAQAAKKTTAAAKPAAAPKAQPKPKPKPNKPAPKPSGAEGPKRRVPATNKPANKPTPVTPKTKYKLNPDAQKPRRQGKNLNKAIAVDKSNREGPQGPLAQLARKGIQSLMNRGAAKEGDTRIGGGGKTKQTYRNGKWVTTHTKSSSGKWVLAK